MPEMPRAERELLDEIKVLERKYFTFDEPVPFCGLKFYPLTVRQYDSFLLYNDCFLLNKNDDPRGVVKSHLDYLLDKMQDKEEGPLWSYKFCHLVEMTTRVKNGFRCPKCGKFYSFEEFVDRLGENNKTGLIVCDCGEGGIGKSSTATIRYVTDEKTKRRKLVIDGNEIDHKSFVKFRRIPLYQNLPDYHDDSWVHPAVREDQRMKQELLAKKNGDTSATLERKIVCVAAKSSYKIHEIYDMPMRKFVQLLEVIDDAMTYETSRIGMMSGVFAPKTQIEHWVYKKNKGMYGAAVDADTFIQKIQNA